MCWQNIKIFVSALMVHNLWVKEGTTEFKNYFKQMPAPFSFMLNLIVICKVLKVVKLLIQKSMKIAVFVVLLTSLFVLMINLVNQLLFLKLQMLLTYLLKQLLKSISIVKKLSIDILTKIGPWVKKKNNFNQATFVGCGKNSLMMTTKNLEICVT